MNEITWRASCLLLFFHFYLHKFSKLFYFETYLSAKYSPKYSHNELIAKHLLHALSYFFIFDMLSFCSSESPTFLPHPTYIHTHSSKLSQVPLPVRSLPWAWTQPSGKSWKHDTTVLCSHITYVCYLRGFRLPIVCLTLASCWINV